MTTRYYAVTFNLRIDERLRTECVRHFGEEEMAEDDDVAWCAINMFDGPLKDSLEQGNLLNNTPDLLEISEEEFYDDVD